MTDNVSVGDNIGGGKLFPPTAKTVECANNLILWAGATGDSCPGG